MDSPSYRSFLVRLWHEPSAADSWRGEVESIQSGHIVAADTLDTTLEIIRQAVGNSQPPASPTPTSDHGLTDDQGASP